MSTFTCANKYSAPAVYATDLLTMSPTSLNTGTIDPDGEESYESMILSDRCFLSSVNSGR